MRASFDPGEGGGCCSGLRMEMMDGNLSAGMVGAPSAGVPVTAGNSADRSPGPWSCSRLSDCRR